MMMMMTYYYNVVNGLINLSSKFTDFRFLIKVSILCLLAFFQRSPFHIVAQNSKLTISSYVLWCCCCCCCHTPINRHISVWLVCYSSNAKTMSLLDYADWLTHLPYVFWCHDLTKILEPCNLFDFCYS